MDSDDIGDVDAFVQLDVVRSEFADPQDLLALASERGQEVHHTLAEFGRLPAEAVTLLAGHPDAEVRALLVRNMQLAAGPAALREALLVEDTSSWVRSELLELDLSVAMRTRVLASLRESEILHPQDWMPEDLLHRLAAGAGDDDMLRSAAVRCLPGDSAALREMAASSSSEVRCDGAANPVLPLELRRRLAADEHPLVRQFAVSAELGPAALSRLARDAHAAVRAVTAEACRQLFDLPASEQSARDGAAAVLAELAGDPDEWVRAEVALHLPLQALLVEDDSDHVRWRLASTTTDPALLRRLAERPDPEYEVIPSLVGNGCAPVTVLRELHDRLLVEWTAASGLLGDDEPDEGFARLHAMRESEALARLVANPALPEKLVPPLLVHRAPAIAEAALRRVPADPQAVPVRALRRRAVRGLLWQRLAQAGADVHDPAVRAAVLDLLPTAAGSVADLAAAVRR